MERKGRLLEEAENDFCEVVADEGVEHPASEKHWQRAGFDLLESDLVFLPMQHGCVWGAGRGSAGDKDDHADAHADGDHRHVWIHIFKCQSNWNQDARHAGIVGKVCCDDSHEQENANEHKAWLVAEDWGHGLNDEFFQASLRLGYRVADINSGGNNEDDFPGDGGFGDGAPVQHWAAFKAQNHQYDDAQGKNPDRAIGVEQLCDGPGFWHKAWCQRHNDEEQASQECGFLLDVHWRQRRFGELFWVDIAHFGNVWTQDELYKEQEEHHHNDGKAQVVDDVAGIAHRDR